MFKKLENIIDIIFSKKDKKEYEKYLIIKSKWAQKIEKKIQENAKVIDYSNENLTLKAKNPSWKNELIFFEEEIKKNFQHQK